MNPLERLGLEVVAYTILGKRYLASFLLVLLDHNGSVASYEALQKARRWKMVDDDTLTRKAIQVRICLLRQALEDLGFPGVIKTEDEGYSIPRPAKQRILSRLIEEASA